MQRSSFFFISGFYTILTLVSGQKSRCDNFPFERKDQCAYAFDRTVPIALLTSTAVEISAPKLEITFSDDAEITFQNNGVTVRGQVTKGCVNITGGPVWGNKYHMDHQIFRNDAVPNNTRCGGTHDGVGTAVRHDIFFYNYAYSMSDMSKYGDAILELAFLVNVEGVLPNKKFEPFANVLKHIRQVNSTYTTTVKNSASYLLETLTCPGSRKIPYYVYPASTKSLTGKFIPNNIIIEQNWKCRARISYPQFFNDVLQLKDSNGQLLANPEPLYPQNRPLRQIRNVIELQYHPR